MRRAEAVALILVGTATTVLLASAAVEDFDNRLILIAILLVGPMWAMAFCLASDESDFSGGGRSRSQWLSLLPWTFLLAPLVLPNFILMASFFRDSRADGGRSPLTWDRMRPGEDGHDR